MRRIPLDSGDYVRLEAHPLVLRLAICDSQANWLGDRPEGALAYADFSLAAAEELHRQLGDAIREQRAQSWREPGAAGVAARREDLRRRAA
jgi:hypothetical protein